MFQMEQFMEGKLHPSFNHIHIPKLKSLIIKGLSLFGIYITYNKLSQAFLMNCLPQSYERYKVLLH